jgi:hypothetical protein
MGAIFRILYDARVSVALAGHDHPYERSAPLDRNRRLAATLRGG